MQEQSRNHNLVPQQPGQPDPRQQQLVQQQVRQPAPQQAYYPVPQPAEMDQVNPRRRISAGAPLAAVLLGPLTLFIWPMIATYKAGEHIAATQRAAGLAPTCSGAIGLLLLFLVGLTPLYYQSELNKVLDG